MTHGRHNDGMGTKKSKRQIRYVRVDSIPAWDLLGVLAQTSPKSVVIIRESTSGQIALVEHPNGPWVLEGDTLDKARANGVAVLK